MSAILAAWAIVSRRLNPAWLKPWESDGFSPDSSQGECATRISSQDEQSINRPSYRSITAWVSHRELENGRRVKLERYYVLLLSSSTT